MRRQIKAAYTGGTLGTKAVSLGDVDDFLDYLVDREVGSDEPQDLYRAVAWTYWCVNLRADAIASIPYLVYPIEIEEDEEDKDVEWSVDMRRILWNVEAWLCLKAAAYVLKRVAGDTLEALQVLNSNTMKVKEWDDNGPTLFEQRVGTKVKLYKPEQLCYFRTFDPHGDIREGIASGNVGRRSASIVLAANEWASAYFKNGAIPAVFLTTEGAVPKEEKDRIQSAWEKMLKGVRQAFKTTVLERGLTPTVIGQPVKDLAMPALDKAQREQILAAHKIPPGLAEAKTNRAEREMLEFELWENCIIPEGEVWIEPVLNEQLFNPLGLRISFQYHEMEALQRMEIAKAESMAFAITGVMLPAYKENTVSVEEVRSWIDSVGQSAGLPPLSDTFEPEERVTVAPPGQEGNGGPSGPGAPTPMDERIESRTGPKAVPPEWGRHRVSLPS